MSGQIQPLRVRIMGRVNFRMNPTTRIAVLVLCTLGAVACGGSAPEPAALAEPTPAAAPASPAGDGLSVTGTAPVSPDGSLTVVILEPAGNAVLEPPDTPAQMDQINMEFLPPVVLATVGQPVHFVNSEDILHNVRVFNIDTKETAFNIATPIGGTYEHYFDTAGTYRVACDIQPQMGASSVITRSPYAAVADRGGAFALDNVAPGAYTALVQAGAERSSHAVMIADGATTLTLGSN